MTEPTELIPVQNQGLTTAGLTPAGLTAPGLTPAQYGALAAFPPELEWLANLTNPQTRRAYQTDVREFSAFTGLNRPRELRTVTRAHVIAWRLMLLPRAFRSMLVNKRIMAHLPYRYRPGRSFRPVFGTRRPSQSGRERRGSGARVGRSASRSGS